MPMDAPSAACGATDATVAAVAPILVIGIGNPSRGDDALGPACIARFEQARPQGVELLTDYQLQIEHALDLDGRELVIFVDASVAAGAPFRLETVGEEAGRPAFSHALSPAQLLGVYRLVHRCAPPAAQVLAIRGYAFELGAPLSEAARANLDRAVERLAGLLDGAPQNRRAAQVKA